MANRWACADEFVCVRCVGLLKPTTQPCVSLDKKGGQRRVFCTPYLAFFVFPKVDLSKEDSVKIQASR